MLQDLHWINSSSVFSDPLVHQTLIMLSEPQASLLKLPLWQLQSHTYCAIVWLALFLPSNYSWMKAGCQYGVPGDRHPVSTDWINEPGIAQLKSLMIQKAVSGTCNASGSSLRTSVSIWRQMRKRLIGRSINHKVELVWEGLSLNSPPVHLVTFSHTFELRPGILKGLVKMQTCQPEGIVYELLCITREYGMGNEGLVSEARPIWLQISALTKW